MADAIRNFGSYGLENNKYIDPHIDDPRLMKMTNLHETCHQLVMLKSLYGQLLILLKKIEKNFHFGLDVTINELNKASITTLESSAMLFEDMILLFEVYSGDREALVLIDKNCRDDVRQLYCLPSHVEILALITGKNNVKWTSMPLDLAIMAMNIDLTETDIKWLDPDSIADTITGNKINYYVDYRYKRLTAAALAAGKEPDYDEFLKKIQPDGRTLNTPKEYYDAIVAMLDRLIEQLSEQTGTEADVIRTYIYKDFMPYEQYERAMSDDNTYEMYEKFMHSSVPAHNSRRRIIVPKGVIFPFEKARSVFIYLSDEEIKKLLPGGDALIALQYSQSEDEFYMGIKADDISEFLKVFPGTLILNGQDYDDFQKYRSYCQEKKVFFEYAQEWDDFKSNILKHGDGYFYWVPFVIDDKWAVVFATCNKTDVFYTVQFKDNLQYILDHPSDRLVYVNSNDTIDHYLIDNERDARDFLNVIAEYLGPYKGAARVIGYKEGENGDRKYAEY